MNLRNNKGYTGVDILITILILVILIPVIAGMAYNIGKSKSSIEQKTYAVSNASNILEIAKSVESIKNIYSTLSDTPETIETSDDFIEKLQSNFQDELAEETDEPQINEEDGEESIIFTIKDENGRLYKAKIDVEDFADTGSIEGAEKNIVKKVTAKITYSVGNKLENIEISTIVSKE